MREFEIPYVGLKVGVHNFDYEIDRKFFDHFEDSPIHDCAVKVKLEFEKKETFFILKFFIDGNVNVECDRCLVPFNKSIFGDYTSYVKFSENADIRSRAAFAPTLSLLRLSISSCHSPK